MRFSVPAFLSGLALLAAGTLAVPLPAQSGDSSRMVARETSTLDLEARAYFDDIFSYNERFFDDDLDLEAREPVVDPTHFRIGIIIRPHEPVPALLP
ncbi:hypothetical protein D9619_012114 [Psilocybe cf. subviscida]|uniref:Uncharacterized protein n=1 Tax=Psilocybe cf. subviscida TaxID=2480587 RepID=A0A8H5B7N7_9AGAR|nr:hypothetical protein D9619_012114 [Psilocybe cf. subviscida]